MISLSILLLTACVFVKTQSCNDNQECLDNFIDNLYHEMMPGFPSLGIAIGWDDMGSEDPLYVEVIGGNYSILNFKLKNVNVTGYSTCKLSNVKVSLTSSFLKFDANCERFGHEGQYEINGKLLTIAVHGSGDYSIVAGKYYFGVDAELKIVQDESGKSYLSIKNFKSKSRADGPIQFDFKNLFDGDKVLSDAVHDFAHDNWKMVSEFVEEAVFQSCLKEIFSNFNKYLKTKSIEELKLKLNA